MLQGGKALEQGHNAIKGSFDLVFVGPQDPIELTIAKRMQARRH